MADAGLLRRTLRLLKDVRLHQYGVQRHHLAGDQRARNGRWRLVRVRGRGTVGTFRHHREQRLAGWHVEARDRSVVLALPGIEARGAVDLPHQTHPRHPRGLAARLLLARGLVAAARSEQPAELDGATAYVVA